MKSVSCIIVHCMLLVIKHSNKPVQWTRAIPVIGRLNSSTSRTPKVRSPLRQLLDTRTAKTAPGTKMQVNVSPLTDLSNATGLFVNVTSETLASGYRWDNRAPVPDGPLGTHSGKFHCDEVLAMAMLKVLPEFESRAIVRSRDKDELAKCSIVVDVGGEFDPPHHRYDHHQKSFTYTMRHLQPTKPWDIKLSSSGLIYCFFGRDVIAHILGWNIRERLADVEKIYDKVYENFMQEMDAVDNGVKQTERESLRYQINTNLSARVGFFNPFWNNESNSEIEMQRFVKAMALVRDEFVDRVRFYAEVWLPARSIVEHAVKERHAVDPSGDIIVFNEGSCPWKEHLTDIESESHGTVSPAKLVVFADTAPNSWRVQGVPLEPHSYDLRVPLPQAWRALRDEDLQRVSGVPDAVFCHVNGFIGGARTREGAVKMAKLTLQMHYNNGINGSLSDGAAVSKRHKTENIVSNGDALRARAAQQ